MRPVTQQQAKSSGRSSGSFLGKENIPLLGLGLAALGRPGYINIGHGMDLKETKCDVEAMRSRCHAVLDTAKDLGLRYIDCARSYGRSEDFLSSWFGDDSRTRPDDMLVGSKWGYRYTADWRVDTAGAPHEVKEHSATHLASQVQETCGHLGNFINLYQTHSATLDSGALSDEVVAGLWAIRKEKGWRIGLSLSGVAQSETLRAAMRVKDPQTGEMLFQCVQVRP